jgi:hypothetical protein
MTKWGIRLIAVSFLLGMMLNLFGLITGINPPHGFLGFSWVSPSVQFDIMAWIGLCVNLYIGYHLLKFKDQGRIWALTILWISAFSSVFGLVLFYFGNHLSPISMVPVTAHYFNYSFKSSLLLISGIAFALYVIQICFLMSKDVKTVFQGQEIAEAKTESG